MADSFEVCPAMIVLFVRQPPFPSVMLTNGKDCIRVIPAGWPVEHLSSCVAGEADPSNCIAKRTWPSSAAASASRGGFFPSVSMTSYRHAGKNAQQDADR
jgi:hypothetical protein